MILISETFELSFGSTNERILNSFLERYLARIRWSWCLVKGSLIVLRRYSSGQIKIQCWLWSVLVLISVYGFWSDLIRWLRIMTANRVVLIQTLSIEPWCGWTTKKMFSTCFSFLNNLTDCDWRCDNWSVDNRRFWLVVTNGRYSSQWYWGYRRGRYGRVRMISKSLVFDLSF